MKNKLFEHVSSNQYWRVLYLAGKKPGSTVWVLIFKEQQGGEKLKKLTLGHLKKLLNEGVLIPLSFDPFFPDLSKSISAKEKAKLEERWSTLKNFVVHEPRIYQTGGLQQLYRQIGSPLSPRQIRRLLDKYWRGGCVPKALLPDYRNCGNKGESRIKGDSVLGRPGIYNTNTAKLKEDDIKRLKKGYHQFYLKKKIRNQKSAYTKTINAYFKHLLNQENYLDQLPSFRQFCYHGKKALSAHEQEKLKAGSIIFNKDKRISQRNSNDEVSAVGEVYQIDSTPGDIHIVSSLDYFSYIGRPTLYIIVDVFSRLIAGYCLEVENPSYQTASLALFHAATKKQYCTSDYNTELASKNWPSEGVPRHLVADKGELLKRKADVLVQNLGINLENKGSYRPDLKGIVESLFKSVQERVKYQLEGKGAIEGNLSKRISRDTRKDACITLAVLRQLIQEEIYLHNEKKFQENLPLTKEMIRDKVAPIPKAIWDWATQKGLNFTRFIPTDNLRHSLLPVEECNLRQNGVRFNRVDYSCIKEEDKLYISNLRFQKVSKVDIAYDIYDLGHVYLQTENSYITLKARSRNHLEGVSLIEQHLYHHDLKSLKAHFEKQEQDARLKSDRRISELLKSAHRQEQVTITENAKFARDAEKLKERVGRSRKPTKKSEETTAATSTPKNQNAKRVFKRKEYDELDEF